MVKSFPSPPKQRLLTFKGAFKAKLFARFQNHLKIVTYKKTKSITAPIPPPLPHQPLRRLQTPYFFCKVSEPFEDNDLQRDKGDIHQPLTTTTNPISPSPTNTHTPRLYIKRNNSTISGSLS